MTFVYQLVNFSTQLCTAGHNNVSAHTQEQVLAHIQEEVLCECPLQQILCPQNLHNRPLPFEYTFYQYNCHAHSASIVCSAFTVGDFEQFSLIALELPFYVEQFHIHT